VVLADPMASATTLAIAPLISWLLTFISFSD
jgi:hypothetical protein